MATPHDARRPDDPPPGTPRGPDGRGDAAGPSVRTAIPWLIGTFVVALTWLVARIDLPPVLIFDEPFYRQVAQLYNQGTWVIQGASGFSPPNREHPPLAKMFFALAMEFDPEGRLVGREASAVFGALGAAGAGFLAYRLTRSRAAMLLAPFLLLVDPMWDLHARILILDVFAAAFMVWAFAVALTDHRWAPYLSGLFAAFGAASKYIALVLFPVLAVIIWCRSDAYGRSRHDAHTEDPLTASKRTTTKTAPAGRSDDDGRTFRRTALAVAAIPTAVMLLVHLPIWLAVRAELGAGEATGQVLFLIIDGIFLGTEALATHQQETAPLSWLILQQPMFYFVDTGTAGDGLFSAIYAVGSPVIWWGAMLGAAGFLAVPVKHYVAAVLARRKKQGWSAASQVAWNGLSASERARFRSLGLVTAIFIAGFLPFLLLTRATFIYYMVLLLPYLAVMLAIVLVGLWEHRWGAVLLRPAWSGRALVVVVLVAAVALAVLWWPIYTGAPMTVERFRWITDTVPWSNWPNPGRLGGA